MTIKERLHQLVDELPESEAEAMLGYARELRRAERAELRARLESFAEEWESPEMDAYDNYDVARAAAG